MTPLPTRREALSRAKAAGKRIAAAMPIHYPRALLRAHGFHPVEVWGPPGIDPTIGNSHFQAYTCAIVRNATSFALAGKLDVADVLLVPHTCDALQGMGSVLKDFATLAPKVLTLYLPRGRRPSDEEYLVLELKKLAGELSAVSGVQPTDDELLAAIRQEEAADAAFSALTAERENVALSDRDFYALLRSREYLDAEAFIEATKAAPRGACPAKGVKLVLSGIVPEPMAIFDVIDECGARVVADDMACLTRRVHPVGAGDDPWLRMTRWLLSGPPDPTLGTPIPERVAAMKRSMKDRGAQGMLVYDPKFCEPELFYLPLLRKGLDEVGLPLLHVEFDMSDAMSAQTRTRIEAFVEMLR